MRGQPDRERKKRKDAIIMGADDNVAVVLEDVAEGEELYCRGDQGSCIVETRSAISRGHKVAIRAVALNGSIVKCGIPIGFASKTIQKGEFVHIHNLWSFIQKGSL
jgi:hypothetical protein